MSLIKHDKGSAILLEVEYKKQTPYGTLDYFDPSPVPKISVIDPLGQEVVTPANLVQSTTGRYYYVIQSSTAWEAGTYSCKTTGGDGTNSDVTINRAAFELV